MMNEQARSMLYEGIVLGMAGRPPVADAPVAACSSLRDRAPAGLDQRFRPHGAETDPAVPWELEYVEFCLAQERAASINGGI